jgi:FAD/FMN-containing dehydrogenase
MGNSERALADQLRGRSIRPGDQDYDTARAVWNGMIDHRPALIVQCADVGDVIATVSYARNHHLPLTVRGGGHNVSGNAVAEGSVVVDLSRMRDVEVDPDKRRVRVQGGATLGDVDRATQEFGLAVPLGVASETGVAGLTLGGGVGWLLRAYGLTCDNVVAADVVTGSGDHLRVSETENSELMWALRRAKDERPGRSRCRDLPDGRGTRTM